MAGWGATKILTRHVPVTGRVIVIDARDVAASVTTTLEMGGAGPDTDVIMLVEIEPAESRQILNPTATIPKRPAGPVATAIRRRPPATHTARMQL